MSRTDILLSSIEKFYNDSNNVEKLLNVLERKDGISLRNLEWFITDYSKKTNLSYKTEDGKQFTVHCAYKASLDGYSKKLFDPFCRTEKIDFKGLHTTVAQLNFIRWCIKNNIIDYVKENKDNLLSRKK